MKINIKKNNLSTTNLNKKFDREINKSIDIKQTRENKQLYDFIMSNILDKISLAYTQQYAVDMKNGLLEDISNFITKLEELKLDDKEANDFISNRILELRRLYEQISNIDNDNKSETITQ